MSGGAIASAYSVMVGLDPAIHAAPHEQAEDRIGRTVLQNGVEGRVKPNHDGMIGLQPRPDGHLIVAALQ